MTILQRTDNRTSAFCAEVNSKIVVHIRYHKFRKKYSSISIIVFYARLCHADYYTYRANPGCEVIYILQGGHGWSSQIVNSMPACLNRFNQSADKWWSVNRWLILIWARQRRSDPLSRTWKSPPGQTTLATTQSLSASVAPLPDGPRSCRVPG